MKRLMVVSALAVAGTLSLVPALGSSATPSSTVSRPAADDIPSSVADEPASTVADETSSVAEEVPPSSDVDTSTTSTSSSTTTTSTTSTTTTSTTSTSSTTTSTTTTTRPVVAPSAPRSLAVATAASGQLRLSWVAPASNGGAPVTNYVVQRSTNGVSFTTIATLPSTALSYTAVGLTNGTRSYFRVLARNASRLDGAWTATVSGVPGLASAPRGVVATPASTAVRLAWSVPAATGGFAITDYIVQWSPRGTNTWTSFADGVRTTTTATVTGLRNGVAYDFRVVARNAVGSSPVSNVVTSTPRTVPTAVRALGAAPGNRTIRLAWTAPASNGGAAVTDYVIQRSPNGTSGWLTITDGVGVAGTFTVGNLANGTRVYFRVMARNAAGLGPATVVSSIPRTVASAPRSVSATAGGDSLTVRWAAPASNGGAAITGYAVQRATSPSGPWTTFSVSSTTLAYTSRPLLPPTRFYFRVAARNAAGTGAWSTVVSGVPSPGCHPSYPTVCIRWTGVDLDCSQIPYRRFRVVTPSAPYTRDPHGFDGYPYNGVGCES